MIDPELEANYNIVAARGGVDEVMQRWAAASAAVRETADASLDCAYGAGEREKLDLFRCGSSNAPLYVYIHGGYWQRGDKSLYSFIAPQFLSAGIDVAIIGYPLCPQVSMTSLLDSVRRAIAWLYNNATDLGINSERINLSGHSAGGQLTAMGLCTDWQSLDASLPRDLLKTAIPFSGLYDLEPLLRTSISEALNLSDTEIQALSPARLNPVSSIPMLTILGGLETGEFFRQTDALEAAWRSRLPSVERHVEPDVDHIDLIDRLADPNSEIFARISASLR